MLGFCALAFVVLGSVRGCSPPVGGFVEPTEAELVFYADYVVIGKVTKIIKPDPVMPYDTTYGAQLQISCQYKGGNIARDITIVGAGFIPGHCTANELKQNIDYILFLSKKENGYFEQTSTARNVTTGRKFLQVCDLSLKYPIGVNSDFPNARCQAPTTSKDCERYTPPVNQPTPVGPPSPPPRPITDSSSPPPKPTTHSPEHVENVQMTDKNAAQKGLITTTPSGAEANHCLSFLLVSAIVLEALVFL